MPLSPDEQLHLTAAEGFLSLGMFMDADAALDDIDPFCRHLPGVAQVDRFYLLRTSVSGLLDEDFSKKACAVDDSPNKQWGWRFH